MRERSDLPEDWEPRTGEKRTLIANIGDSHPLRFGGHLIYKYTYPRQKTEYHSVYFGDPLNDDETDPEEGVATDDSKYEVYRWWIAPDVFQDEGWVGEDGIIELAKSIGSSPEDLKQASRDPDVRVRARLYEDIGRHFGFENVGGSSDTRSRADMQRLYPELKRSLVR